MRRGIKTLVGFCILMLLGIPLLYYSVSYSTGLDLYDGDRIEKRECRICGGSGKDEAQAREMPALGDRCSFCRGTGKVKVILPGPNRPTRVWGVVVDRDAIGDATFFYPRNVKKLPMPSELGPPGAREHFSIPGALAGATVVFRRDHGEAIEIQTNAEGRFSRRLAPGHYEVTVRAAGFKEFRSRKTLDIEPLRAPIWIERATLVRPIGDGYGDRDPWTLSAEEARGTYGLIFAGGVSRKSAGQGFYHTYAAEN
jgi:hypothetical protein